jgi:YD repeat-containing protein
MSNSNDIYGVNSDGKRTVQLNPDNEPQTYNRDGMGRVSSVDLTLSSGDVYRQTITRDGSGNITARSRWVLQP